MTTRDVIQRLPKAELHVHLDAVIRPTTMVALAKAAKFSLPTTDPDALRRFMLVGDGMSLDEYLERFDQTIPLLQTPESIERVAYEAVEDAARDNIRYLEMRYCPMLSTKRGMPLQDVLDAEWRGLSRGEQDFGVVSRIINCSLRHYDPGVSIELAECSVANRHQGVVAFDLAGGEAGRPPAVHRAAFDIAQDGLIGITVHAGEAAGPESIREALLRCHANRIGHGTRLFEDPALMAYVRERQVPIEINLTSNVKTGAVRSLREHPVNAYFAAGIPVTLCTDGWLMTGATLSDEYWLAHDALGFTRADIDRMIVAGFEAAFLPWPERRALVSRIRDELEGIR